MAPVLTNEQVDTHDPAGMAAFLRERAKANREIAGLPIDQWPHRPDVLKHWALRFEQAAQMIESLNTKRQQAEHERDCAVEQLAARMAMVDTPVEPEASLFAAQQALLTEGQRADELQRILRGLVNHWNEFGPEDGLDELMDRAHKRLQA